MFFQGRNRVKTVIRDGNHVSADLHMAFGFWPLLGLLVAISIPPQLFVPPSSEGLKSLLSTGDINCGAAINHF